MECMLCSRPSELRKLGKNLAQMARLMIGQPDYESYVAHRQATHPGEAVMSRTEFFRDRENSRYGVGASRAGVFRCC